MVNTERIRRDVVVIGTSAGGVETLAHLFERLPRDLPAAIAVIQHRSPVYNQNLATVLARWCSLPLVEPQHGEPFRPGRIYLAPPDIISFSRMRQSL